MTELPLFPLARGVLPDGMLRLNIFEVRYLDLIKRCHRDHSSFGVVWLEQGSEVLKPDETPKLHVAGCSVQVRAIEAAQPSLLHIECRGQTRFWLDDYQPGRYGVWQGQVRFVDPDPVKPIPNELQGVTDRLGSAIRHAQEEGSLPQLAIYAPYQLEDCGWVANRLIEALPLPGASTVAMMMEADPEQRLRQVAAWLNG
jgi:Lon protease-like protein